MYVINDLDSFLDAVTLAEKMVEQGEPNIEWVLQRDLGVTSDEAALALRVAVLD